jgi:hypothetical protein
MLGWLHPFFPLLNKEQKKHSNYHYEHVDHAHNCTFSGEKDVKVNRVQSNIGYQRDGNQPDQYSGEKMSASLQWALSTSNLLSASILLFSACLERNSMHTHQ